MRWRWADVPFALQAKIAPAILVGSAVVPAGGVEQPLIDKLQSWVDRIDTALRADPRYASRLEGIPKPHAMVVDSSRVDAVSVSAKQS